MQYISYCQILVVHGREKNDIIQITLRSFSTDKEEESAPWSSNLKMLQNCHILLVEEDFIDVPREFHGVI